MLDVFKTTGALLEGHFRLTSGRHSNTYFQCAKVLQYPEHLTAVCSEIARHFAGKNVETVISPAIGGIVVGTEVGRQLGVKTIFAERKDGVMTIRRGFSLEPDERVLPGGRADLLDGQLLDHLLAAGGLTGLRQVGAEARDELQKLFAFVLILLVRLGPLAQGQLA